MTLKFYLHTRTANIQFQQSSWQQTELTKHIKPSYIEMMNGIREKLGKQHLLQQYTMPCGNCNQTNERDFC